jgi:hypothetical protein
MAEPDDLTSSPHVNWSRFLEQTARDYETPPARGLTHGLQKEAIQNGWGARDGRKKWAFAFQLHHAHNQAPRLLSMTDSGTLGLIGDHKFDADKLPENESIPEAQRLARFEAMFESGDTAFGPGLFGRGKLIFNAVSKQKLILYDSLTKDGKYRFGIRHIVGRGYHQFKQAYEGKQALAELTTRTQGRLDPLTVPGTRITVVDPIEEVVEALDDGSFLHFVEDTWWEIIEKHDAEITVQMLPAQPDVAKVPGDFGHLPTSSSKGWRIRYSENLPVPAEGHRYRLKTLHMLVPPVKHAINPDLLGLWVHRRGMVIGRINLSGIPSEISERFFGYAFLDSELEDALAEQENTTHYGFRAHMRPPYRNLRQILQIEFDKFLEELGLKKPETSAEEKVRRLIEDAQADLNSILNGLGVPGFGAGRLVGDDLNLSVENLEFPSGTNRVSVGDSVAGFHFKLENLGSKTRKLRWQVETFDRDTGTIETLFPNQQVTVKAKSFVYTESHSIDIHEPPYKKHTKVGCVCQVSDEATVVAKRTFFLYIDLKPDVPVELSEIRLASASWPREHSRRVDFGQSIADVTYEVENRTPKQMKSKVRVRTLWAAEGNAPIADIQDEQMLLTAFQTQTFTVPAVEVTEEIYQEVKRGKVNLRCHSAALTNTDLWLKGDRLAESTVSFFLNMDPAYGFWEDTVFHDGGPGKPRSEPRQVDASGRTWKLSINETHPAYIRTKDDELRCVEYLFEEMARQTIYVLLKMNQEGIVAKLAELAGGQKVDDLTAAEVVEDVAYKVTDRVLAVYYGG